MEYPKRKPMRLKNYDYSSNGAYFVTITTYERRNLFGRTVGEGFHPLPSIELSEIGLEVEKSIEYMEKRYGCVDKYVIMPNHIHIIILLREKEGEKATSLPEILGRMKSYTTYRFNQMKHTKDVLLWQRTYHDHIIREEIEYQEIWNYIDANPLKWMEDCYYCV